MLAGLFFYFVSFVFFGLAVYFYPVGPRITIRARYIPLYYLLVGVSLFFFPLLLLDDGIMVLSVVANALWWCFGEFQYLMPNAGSFCLGHGL